MALSLPLFLLVSNRSANQRLSPRFMAASKVLGEESVKEQAQGQGSVK